MEVISVTIVEYDEENNHFIFNIGNTPIIVSPTLAEDIQFDINKAMRRYKKEKNKEKLSLRDEVVAKTIISKEKETGKFQGMKSSDFGL